MNSPTRRIAFVCLMSALCWLAPAAAEMSGPDLVIGSGYEGGNYHAIARRLRTLLSQLEDHYDVEIRTSTGSLQNLVQLDEPGSPVGLALTQADALRGFLDVNPGFVSKFVVIADVGRECVFLIGARNGGISSAADLKRSGDRVISVGRPGSGAAITYAYLTKLDSGFRNTPAVNEDIMVALAQIEAHSEFSKIAGAMLVQRPRILAPPLKIAVEHPETYSLVPFRSGDVKRETLPDGKPVYSFETVRVRHLDLDTVCTRELLIASKSKVSEDLRSRLAEIWLEHSRYIAPGAR